MDVDDNILTESRPLLPNEPATWLQSQEQPLPKGNASPLPWLQFANTLLVEFCVALDRLSVQPYINQLISELDVVKGDKRKIGYYLGLLESLRFVTNTLTMLPLSRLSDYIGRKPVMLIGMVASTVSILCFGLSQTFLGLVLSICIGAINCNLGVVKVVVGDIMDSTNQPRGFAWVLVLWSVGGTISSLIGGDLSNPSDRFPRAFNGAFWKQYPYFLPCLAVAIILMLSISFVLFFFEETLPKRSNLSRNPRNSESSLPCSVDGPPSIRRLLTYRIVITAANYTIFDTLFTCRSVFIPLYLSMPIESGGLDFDPITIGYILGSYRALTALFLIFGCPRMVHHLGVRRAFHVAIYNMMFGWLVMPIANILARRSGTVTMSVWTCVALLSLSGVLLEMGTACGCIYITAVAPSQDSLGAVNGLSRTMVAIGNAIGPLLTTSLFSLSVEYDICDGYAVYIALFAVSCFSVLLATRLHHVTLVGEERRNAIV